MHLAVENWVVSVLERRKESPQQRQTGNNVLEIGSLNIDGQIRHLFLDIISAGGSYTGVDLRPGDGVDVVVDATVMKSKVQLDIIVCAEVFQHTPVWPAIIKNSYNNLKPGGLFIATMAGEGRTPSSAIDNQQIRSWEFYRNVTEEKLASQLKIFRKSETDVLGEDLRCWAIK